MPLPKVVLDTNVVVSALLSERGNEALVLDLCLAQKLQLYVSKDILTEYEEVLKRPRFKIDPKHVAAVMQLIRKAAKIVKPIHALAVCTDEDDNRFLECTEAAAADYLVTGNLRHFPKQHEKTRVLNARSFIEIITPDLQR